jgi:hypothetical protein
VRRSLLAAAVVALLLAGAAQADVGVYGPPSSTRVLVLVPGLGGGAGDFSLIASELVRRVPNLQVWTPDRREAALEDPSGFASGDPAAAYAYYLGGQPLNGKTFDPNLAGRIPQAKGWGAAVALSDLRRVVLRARAGGKREVILGGHSIGAATAATYAAWDFAGHPGYRDLAGLVLIDGGELGTFGTPTLAGTRAQLAKLAAAASPFADQLGVGVPWLFGVIGRIAALYAKVAPNDPSALAQSPIVPAAFRPPGNPTNADFLAYGLRASGIDVAHCGLANSASLLAAAGQGFTEWYFPTRLGIDLLSAASLRPDPVTRLLGLRVTHLSEIDLPVYAFQTSAYPAVAGARKLVAESRSPLAKDVFARDQAMLHVDPLCTPYAGSRFLQTLVPWLRRR